MKFQLTLGEPIELINRCAFREYPSGTLARLHDAGCYNGRIVMKTQYSLVGFDPVNMWTDDLPGYRYEILPKGTVVTLTQE